MNWETYSKEILPYWIRVTRYDVEYINESNPKALEPYAKAHEQEVTEKDMLMWLNGRYTQQALLSTVCNAEFWHKKGQPPYEYPNKPFFEESEDKPKLDSNGEMILTEEEKKKWRDRLLLGLMIKQNNFEALKREGGE